MNLSISKTNNKSQSKKNILVLLVFSIIAMTIITKQSIVKNAIEMSLKICISTIIPSVFPFMILSDYLICNFTIDKDSKLSRLFCKLFSISSAGVLPFLIGNICGFPLGAQMISKLYENGYIDRDEYERLIPLCGNPSVAFVISGVGMGMRGSIKEGMILYAAIIVSTIISGVIWQSKKSASYFCEFSGYSSFSLTSSVKSAAISSIYISAYIVFFSILIGLAGSFGMTEFVTLILASFLEIGNAASIISRSEIGNLSLPLTAFSLAFSGISVYMQVMCFSTPERRNRYYMKIKFTEGVIAFIITLVLSMLIR